MEGQYTHYILCDVSQLTVSISDRYDWQTHTYTDVERTGTRDVNVTLPTEDDLKSDIESFMDTHGIAGSGTKSELISIIDEWIMENGHPTESESYTYTESVIDTTTDHEATIQDMLDRHPRYFAPRYNSDGTKVLFKGDWTLAELKALGTEYTVFTNEEAKSHISTSADWSDE